MAKGFKHGAGGSNPLNFKIVSYATEEELLAATPKEITIGIVTTDTITSWIFSATEPTEPMEGMVWITTGTSSPVAFNALKKNGIQVYPLSAMQHIGGAWVDVTAKNYQNGEWENWWDGTLYSDGDEYISITGGYEVVGSAELTKNADSMYIKSSEGGVYTANKVNLAGYSKVVIKWTANSSNMRTRFVLSKTKESSYANAAVVQVYEYPQSGSEYITELVIPSPEGYYIGLGRFEPNKTAILTVHEIYAVR